METKKLSKSDKSKILKIKKRIEKINYLGGKCIICGEDNIYKLCFHHRDNVDKKFIISEKRNNRFDDLKDELDKCDLMCNNCHREHHNDDNPTHHQSITIKNNKKNFLEWKGIKYCEKCGYNKCEMALEFHHLYDKKFKLSSIISKNIHKIEQTIREEISKCIVLCSNCHRQEHSGYDWYMKNKDLISNFEIKKISKKNDRNLIKEMYESGMNQAEISVKLGISNQSVISHIIRELAKTHGLVNRTKRVDREIVKEMYESGIKQCEIAKRLNESRPTICKIIKKLGLNKKL